MIIGVNLLVFIVEVFAVSTNGAQLLTIAAESLRTVGVLPATTEPQTLHHWINLSLKYLIQLEKIKLKLIS